MNTFEELQVRALRAPLRSALALPSDLVVLIAHYAALSEAQYLLQQPDVRVDIPFQIPCHTAAHYPLVTLEISGLTATLTCREANGDDCPRTRPFYTLEDLDLTFMGILCSCRGSLKEAARQGLQRSLVCELMTWSV